MKELTHYINGQRVSGSPADLETYLIQQLVRFRHAYRLRLKKSLMQLLK